MARKYVRPAVVVVVAGVVLGLASIARGVAKGVVAVWRERDGHRSVLGERCDLVRAECPRQGVQRLAPQPEDRPAPDVAQRRHQPARRGDPRGDPPDLVGLNDIDVPEFEHEGALLNITQVRQCAAVQVGAQPGPPGLASYRERVLRRSLPRRPLGALVEHDAVQGGRDRQRPADVVRRDGWPTPRRSRPSAPRQSGLRSLVRRRLPGLPRLRHAARHLGERPASAASVRSGSRPRTSPTTSPLAALLAIYRQIWADKEAPADSQTQNGRPGDQDFGKGNIGMLPGDYGFFNTFAKEGLPTSSFADAPLPSENGGPWKHL